MKTLKERIDDSENFIQSDILELVECGKVNLEDTFRQIKVNLPDSNRGFISGNGEGIWALILEEDGVKKYKESKLGETFYVALLNNSIYYPPLSWGNIIKVKCTGKGYRPIIDKNWFNGIILESSNGEFSLDKLLESFGN